MTPEDIIRMARSVRDGGHWSALDLINFGLFVAAAEREACAQLCDKYDDDRGVGETWGPRFAAMIRARGEK